MQNADSIKLALDRAASSPDLAVRQMALSYKEKENELDALKSFFSFYATGATANGKSHGPLTAVEPVRASKPKVAAAKSTGTSVKADTFTAAILDILYKSPEPVKLIDLQMAYEATGLEPPMQKESFRQRMHKRQQEGKVVLIPRVGFWPPEPKADA